MNEKEILGHLLKSAREDFEYFSNANKEERERWVVSEFLSFPGVEHNEEDLHSPEQKSKVDVRFRSALFQVKELPDPDLRRGKMYKDAYNSIKAATSLDKVSLIGDVHDVPPVASMYDLVFEKAEELSNSESYRTSKSELDLLIYVTRTRASLIQPNEIHSEAFTSLGWRSVSCVNTKQGVVLFSSPSAPGFIREFSKKLVSEKC